MTTASRIAQRAAAAWLFPGLVLSMVVGNQGWTIGPVALGQAISWVNDGAAVALVAGRFADRRWFHVLVALTVGGKLLTLAGIAPARADLAFDVGLCALFCAAGAIVVSERPSLVYRQALLIAILSIPVMLLQMTGVAPWSEALNTEHTEDAPEPSPTLFVAEADLRYRTAQARPSGLTHSNNFLSLLAALAVALHFSRLRTPYLTWRDLVVCTFALLTMAKVALVMLAVALVWTLLAGAALERRRAARMTAAVATLLLAYAVLFPGLFAVNTSLEKIAYSFFIRVNDLAAVLPDDSAIKAWLRAELAGTPTLNREGPGGLSGYAQAIHLLPYLLVAGVLLLPLAFDGLRAFRRRYSHVIDSPALLAVLVVLYPAAVPMLRAQIFWFIAGLGLLPAFLVWEPRRFRGPTGILHAPAHEAAR